MGVVDVRRGIGLVTALLAVTVLVAVGFLSSCGGSDHRSARTVSIPGVDCTLPKVIPEPSAQSPDYESICPTPLQQLIPPTARLYCSGPNGALSQSCLRPIYRGQLIAPAAASWNAMNAAYARSHGGARMYPLGSASSYRTIAQQRYLYAHCAHAGWCAVPGRSNHGLGTTIDLGDGGRGSMRAFINAYGRHYGWSKACSDASWEPWHLRWAPLCTGGQYSWPNPGPTGNGASIAKKRCGHGRVLVKGRSKQFCRHVIKHDGKARRYRGEVRRIQRVLRNEGYCAVRVNGHYDRTTRSRVKQFQRAHGLHGDAVIGARTWHKIERFRGGKSRC